MSRQQPLRTGWCSICWGISWTALERCHRDKKNRSKTACGSIRPGGRGLLDQQKLPFGFRGAILFVCICRSAVVPACVGQGLKKSVHDACGAGVAEEYVCRVYDPFYDRAGSKCSRQQVCVQVYVGGDGTVPVASCHLLWRSPSGKKNLWKWKMDNMEIIHGKPMKYYGIINRT